MAKSQSQVPPARARILVISGEPRLRERLYDLLTPHGLHITTAVSCDNGLEFLRLGEPFSLIFLDSAMAPAKRAVFLEHVRYADDRLPVILLERPGEPGASSSSIRRLDASLAADAGERELLALIARWMPAPRAVTPIRYPGVILLIDDESELLASLQAFLQARGCTVATGTSGEAALAYVKTHRPSIVFLDIKMPGMDGLVTLKKLKALRPELPVIMATAVEDEASMQHALALGAHDYIFKPYNLTVLETLLLALKERAPERLVSQSA